MKTVFRLSVLVMIGLLCAAGYAKQKVDAPPGPPEGMVLIPADEFQMESNDPFARHDEQVRTVYVNAFFMDRYEVTNAQYKQFIDANPQWGKDRIESWCHDGDYLKHWNGNDYPIEKANHPVAWVSWYAAMAYAGWAGKRLPTAAEWTQAARGDLVGQKYPWTWGGSFTIFSPEAYNENGGSTMPVGKYSPNGYGLYDMGGNVSEWCLDVNRVESLVPTLYFYLIAGGPITIVIDIPTSVQVSRALRGSSRYLNPEDLWVVPWFDLTRCPSHTYDTVGFRCVKAQSPLNFYPFPP